LRYVTVTRATVLNLLTFRIAISFCMDTLWARTRWPSTLSDTFFHFSFRFLSSLDIAAWHTYCTQHIPCQPPHFSKNFGLDFWLAGGRGLTSFSPTQKSTIYISIYIFILPIFNNLFCIFYILPE
jgi:hypothetical protein